MKHLVKIFESYYDDMSELDKVIDRFVMNLDWIMLKILTFNT